MGQVKVDGPWRLKRTVQTTERGRSYIKLGGQKDLKWTAVKSKSGRFEQPSLVQKTVHYRHGPSTLVQTTDQFWTNR